MSIEELEGELEVIVPIYKIFKGIGPDVMRSMLDKPAKVWADRIHDIECKLLERTLLK